MPETADIRPSPLAGQWYPADPERLAHRVDGYLAGAALPRLEGEVVAVMAPHAGHQYSGPVAAHAFAALRGSRADLIVILSPMHAPYSERLLTSRHDAYDTPLGTVPVDQNAVRSLDRLLRAELGFGLTPVAYDHEHSLEIELPFLQRALAQPFSLLPVMIRDQSAPTARGLGRALAQLFGAAGKMRERNILLVASTDLSHFYPQKTANALDGEILRRVEAFDPQAVIEADEQGHGFACGRGALAAVMWAARSLGADRAQVLNYATSGEITGDFDRVVGYGAAVFLRSTIS